MGWASGTRGDGRLIGYAHEAPCDHPECDTVISLGVDACCGGVHGADEHSCGDYFCGEHLYYHSRASGWVCGACLKALGPDPEDDDDGPEPAAGAPC